MTVLACDFGGRRIKLAVVRDGRVPGSAILPAQSHEPLANRLPDAARALGELLDSQGIAHRACCGIGISYPSIIDPAGGRILDEFAKFGPASSEDLHAWADAEFKLPLVIENDARMAVIGEWQYGAGQGCNNVAILMLGTGLGGGIMGSANVVLPAIARWVQAHAHTPGGQVRIAAGRSCGARGRGVVDS